MLRKTGRFRRADRVLTSRDFERALSSGKRVVSGSFVVALGPERRVPGVEVGISRPRLGITVSRRVGNAVIRNRVKRNVREWFRHGRWALPRGAEVVVIARPLARELSARETAAALDAATLEMRVSVDCRADAHSR